MTPWLTVSLPIQPSKPERMMRLAHTLERANALATSPGEIRWEVMAQETSPWTLAEKQRHAFRTCSTPWVLILSDDVTVCTPGWDDAFRTVAADPNALVLWGNDGRHKHTLSVTACLRTAFAQHILPALERYDHYLIDDAWHDLAERVQGLRYIANLDLLCWEATQRVPYDANHAQYGRDREVFDTTVTDRLALAHSWANRVAHDETLRAQLLTAPHSDRATVVNLTHV